MYVFIETIRLKDLSYYTHDTDLIDKKRVLYTNSCKALSTVIQNGDNYTDSGGAIATDSHRAVYVIQSLGKLR